LAGLQDQFRLLEDAAGLLTTARDNVVVDVDNTLTFEDRMRRIRELIGISQEANAGNDKEVPGANEDDAHEEEGSLLPQ
jgi:hypothetical protein